MLDQERLVAFITTSQPEAARAFYEDVLGLTFSGDRGHALLFDSPSARLMVVKTETATPPRGTALGWSVADLRGSMQRLIERGVKFERFADMVQDDLGVWSPAGPDTGVAWFKDPDGNLLSLSTP